MLLEEKNGRGDVDDSSGDDDLWSSTSRVRGATSADPTKSRHAVD